MLHTALDGKVISITVGCLVYVQEYGDDGCWLEVLELGHNSITCTNGLGESFDVELESVWDSTTDDSVLMGGV